MQGRNTRVHIHGNSVSAQGWSTLRTVDMSAETSASAPLADERTGLRRREGICGCLRGRGVQVDHGAERHHAPAVNVGLREGFASSADVELRRVDDGLCRASGSERNQHREHQQPAVARRRGIGSRGFRKAENQDARRKRLTVPFGLIFWTTVCEITTVHPHAPGIDFSEDQAAPFKMRKLRLFILAPRFEAMGCSTHVHSAAAFRQVDNHHATELVVWPRSVDLIPLVVCGLLVLDTRCRCGDAWDREVCLLR